jgi:methionyl-tRNA synthetase
MSENTKKFYLTTPIYYVNARPHIGHAYTTIAADVIARRQRLLLGQENVWFLTGTDEHGQKIERSAAAAGIPPQQFADQVSAQFESLWKRMGITNDQYIRTTDPDHIRGVQKLFNQLYERGHIYLDSYTGQYSVGEEMFIDGPPGTIGPDGKPTETVTEENFYFRLSAFQRPLIDLIESGTFCVEPEARRNEVLSFLRGNVTEFITKVHEQRTSEDLGRSAANYAGPVDLGTDNPLSKFEEGGEIKRSSAGNPYVPGALKDLSISRSSFDWGIPVPEPAASTTHKKHVIYVWLDALANYMTAVGYGSDKPEDQAKLAKFWPADLHLVGKEIIRFHCVYWPAFLLAADLPLPKKVQAHGWLLFEESKMSKSRGNIVRTETILDAFGSLKPEASKEEQDLFGSDVLRYFLLREIPFGQDGSFSFDALVTRYNAELANGYGNLVSRTLAMIEKYFEGSIPDATGTFADTSDESLKLLQQAVRFKASHCDSYAPLFAKHLGKYDFTSALEEVSSFRALIDGLITETAPWKLGKSDDLAHRYLLALVLYTSAEAIRIITALLYPILPYATAKVWAQLGLGDIEQAAQNGDLKNLEWGGLKPGTKLGPLSPIFPRADKGLIQIMTDMEQNETPKPTPSKLVDEKTTHTSPVPADSTHPGAAPRTSSITEENPGAKVGGSHAISTERAGTPSHTEAPASGLFAASAAASTTPETPQIAIDDFVKIDLRVAKIIVAERIPKADKLLRLEVDLGYEKRQILSGIAEWYTPEELLGKNIVVIANLAPRKMRGLESHGMLLAASHGENGKPILATFAEDIELGSRLK